MSKYTPPSSRKNNVVPVKEEEKKVPVYEEEFPLLVANPTPVHVWSGNKSFVQMVGEFKEKHELETQKQQTEKLDQIKFQRVQQHLPYISNVHNFIEPEDDNYVPQPEPKRQKMEDDDGWVTVDHRKYRKQKSIEEIANRPPTPPEQNEDSVWNTEELEEHETCWEDKRH
jgi:hypothetical protein